MGYEFEGSLTRLGDFKFISRSFTGVADPNQEYAWGNRFADSWLSSVPVPLPKNYVLGIDLQRKDFESYGHECYLGGVWSKTGWWYYYLYALAIKVPLGTWLLLLLACAIRLLNGPSASFRDEFFLLAPAIVILTFVSSQTGVNEHMRYVLPIFPFVFIWLGSVTTCLFAAANATRVSSANAFASCIIVISVVWTTSSSLQCYPHNLSYFNETIGGMRNGWKHLICSNIDWGQDLLYLKKWCDDHPNAKPLRMALYGGFNGEVLGIDGEAFSPDASEHGLAPGYYAVSTTNLSGFGQRDHSKGLRAEIEQIGAYETIGGSIIVFVKD